MKMTRIRIAIALVTTLTCSCAKERPVDTVSDPEGATFSKDLFEKNQIWFHKVTVTRTGENSGLFFTGYQTELSAGRFEFERDLLRFVDATQTYNSGESTDQLVNQWSVRHVDYKLQDSGGRVTNIEVENNDIRWDEKRYFAIDWDSVARNLSSRFIQYCWNSLGARLVEDSEEITEDHIGFTISVDYALSDNCPSGYFYSPAARRRLSKNELTETVEFKYSFRPAKDSEYQPYVYDGEEDPLNQKYGFFKTTVEEVGASNGLVNNRFAMNRWDPSREHKCYFAEDFPEEYKYIYTDPENGIFAKVNQLFARNGLDTRFEILENTGQKFGDVRYCFLKFVQTPDGSAPLGYGPSDANPFTGEIISANSIIWTGQLKYYVKLLEDYQRDLVSSPDHSSVMRHMEKIMEQDSNEWTSTAAAIKNDTEEGKLFNFLLPQYTYGRRGNFFSLGEEGNQNYFPQLTDLSLFNEVMGPTVGQEIVSNIEVAQDGAETFMRRSVAKPFDQYNSTIHEIDHYLGDIYYQLDSGEDSDLVVEAILYNVAMHEFGHNLNLRHNFYGSVDQRNFKSRNSKTSSIMDYLRIDDEVVKSKEWGSYDEAALVYAYSDGEIDLSTENNTTYLYCTDEHRSINALCNAFDYGSSPSEIARSIVKNYDRSYFVRNFRYDRAFWDAGRYSSAVFGSMWDLKKFVRFYEHTFRTNDLITKLSLVDGIDGVRAAEIADTIQSDIKQAALISASLYDAVIQQQITERPYYETYDSFSGALQQKGIASDKIYAGFFLLGDDAFPYDPNTPVATSSYLQLRTDDQVGEKISEIVERNLVNPGDMYLGFDNLLRQFYTISSANYREQVGEENALEQLRIACYAQDTFQRRFNIADTTFFTKAGEPLHPLTFEVLDMVDLDLNQDADPYFLFGTSQIAVIRLADKFYVASKERNKYAFDLIRSRDGTDILRSYYLYRAVTEGRVPECL